MRGRKQSPRGRAAPGGASLREGAEVEVEVERILPGGVGLAHAGGQTVFVALAAPGDRALVRVERARGAVAFASIKELLAPSPAEWRYRSRASCWSSGGVSETPRSPATASNSAAASGRSSSFMRRRRSVSFSCTGGAATGHSTTSMT